MTNDTLENKLNPLDLADLAIFSAASEYSKPQFKGDASRPEYVSTAISMLEQGMTEAEKMKWGGSLAVLKGAQAQAEFSYNQTGTYQLNDILSQYFGQMDRGYKLSFKNSKVSDLNKALAKLGYAGTKIEGHDNLTVTEIAEKAKLDSATEQDKALLQQVAYVSEMLTEVAKTRLVYGSMDSKMKFLNEKNKPKANPTA